LRPGILRTQGDRVAQQSRKRRQYPPERSASRH
jgi:hypothetical protein